MDKHSLIQRLMDIEWSDFEVKKASSELPKDVWETVCAFSNTSGGWLVLGVSQNGKTFTENITENVTESITENVLTN